MQDKKLSSSQSFRAQIQVFGYSTPDSAMLGQPAISLTVDGIILKTHWLGKIMLDPDCEYSL